MTDAASEPDLLTRAIMGDRVALQKLLLSHYPQLIDHLEKRIPRRIQGKISAEDILQQSFVQVMGHIHEFNPKTDFSFSAWLKKIAENSTQDTIRRLTSEKRGGNRRQVRNVIPESSVNDLIEMLSAGSHTPSRSVARHEAIEAIQQSIDALPDDYRQAIQLRLLESKSLTETAEIMNRSPRAVQGLVDRAKKKMRAALGRFSLYE